jgi:hypothetical protein
MKRILLTGFLLTTSLLAFSQLLTEPLKTAKDTANGLIYVLPKTVIKIEVDTRCTEEIPGIYFQYAERFLGLKDFLQTESVHHEIIGFRMKTSEVPDTSQAYLISTGKKGKGLRLEFTPEGFLKSINGANANLAAAPVPAVKSPEKACLKTEPKAWETNEASVLTKEMQQASSTAKMAELAAAQLFAIRDARFNLLTQDLDKTPSDGRSYEIVLSELNRMENAYLDLFRGKQKESTHTYTYTIVPEKDTTDILLRFSILKGVLDRNNLGGNPIFLELKKMPLIADSLHIDRSTAPKGIYFRSPAKAVLRITDGKDELFSREITVNQFGRVLTLPANQIVSMEFCPKTGALLKLNK